MHQLAESNNSIQIEREWIEEFAETVGISFAESACFWMDEISKEQRTELKLKVKETERAAASMGALPDTFLDGLVNVAFANPERLWTDTKAVVEEIGDAWKENAPKRLPLTAEMRDRVPVDSGVLDAMADPENHAMFSTDTDYEIQQVDHSTYYSSYYVKCKDSTAAFRLSDLSAMTTTLLMIDMELPVGDESRKAMPSVRDAILRALDNTNLLMDCGHASTWESKPDFAKAVEKCSTRQLQTKTVVFTQTTAPLLHWRHHQSSVWFPSRVSPDVG